MGGASGKSSVSGRTSTHDVEAIVVGPTAQPLGTASGKHEVTEIRSIDTYGALQREFTYFYSSETKSVVKMTADLSSSRGNRHYET